MAVVIDTEEVGAAEDDQRDPGGNLGSNQSDPACQRPTREGGTPGRVMRLDSTVTAALLHEPSDSSLLWDAMRVMARLLKAATRLPGGGKTSWRDRRRAAKQRAHAIQYTRGRPKLVQLYREPIKLTRATLAQLNQVAAQLAAAGGFAVELWQAKVRHYRPLIERIIAQTERRVVAGESVPAGDKLVSQPANFRVSR